MYAKDNGKININLDPKLYFLPNGSLKANSCQIFHGILLNTFVECAVNKRFYHFNSNFENYLVIYLHIFENMSH